MREQAEQQVGARGASSARKSESARGVTIALFIALLAVGALGAVSLWAMGGTTPAPPTSSQDQLAGRVCTAYQTRNYALLIANIDPTPVPPTQPLPFSDAAKKSLTSTLQAQDSQKGAVTQCSSQQLSGGSADHVQYSFAMTRAKGSKFTPVMNFVREKDGTWEIARNSEFFPLG